MENTEQDGIPPLIFLFNKMKIKKLGGIGTCSFISNYLSVKSHVLNKKFFIIILTIDNSNKEGFRVG